MHSLNLTALRHAAAACFTCKLHHACLSFVSVHQMVPPLTEVGDIQLQLTTHLLTQKDERLSWPGWLTYNGRFSHISGHPVSYRLSAEQGKFVGQRPTFYRCATKPTKEEGTLRARGWRRLQEREKWQWNDGRSGKERKGEKGREREEEWERKWVEGRAGARDCRLLIAV